MKKAQLSLELLLIYASSLAIFLIILASALSIWKKGMELAKEKAFFTFATVLGEKIKMVNALDSGSALSVKVPKFVRISCEQNKLKLQFHDKEKAFYGTCSKNFTISECKNCLLKIEKTSVGLVFSAVNN